MMLRRDCIPATVTPQPLVRPTHQSRRGHSFGLRFIAVSNSVLLFD
ncbi:MAG: hypothetical protein K6C10_02935 [Prevotella sp.]|nr:hypothetical protein [Prevotella sp.]